MKDSSTIKETCSCGATLFFSETFREGYSGKAAYRQGYFHQAHEKCRTKETQCETPSSK